MRQVKDVKGMQKKLGKYFDYNTTIFLIKMPAGGYVQDCKRHFKKATRRSRAMEFETLLEAKVFCIYLNLKRNRSKIPFTVVESYKYIGERQLINKRKRTMSRTVKLLQEIREDLLSGNQVY